MAALTWMIGGPQGSGVDSAAQLYGLSIARAGLHAVGQREYYSNIMGKHSYYKVRASPTPLLGYTATVHLLAAYDEETAIRHVHSGHLADGAAVLVAAGQEATRVDRLPLLTGRARDQAIRTLEGEGLSATVGGTLELAERRGAHVLRLAYDDLLRQVAQEAGDDPARIGIVRNTVAVGASLGLLRLPPRHLEATVRSIFAGKSERIQELNIVAARVGARHATENLPRFGLRLPEGSGGESRIWAQGTQVVGLAKIAAGCRFHSYYPISPATDEATYLEAHPQSGIVVVQTEDEIAAATSAIGAALAGARASTSTSGPGFSLMVEAVGYAGMTEVPLVVVDYMRGGPSTGLPTRTEQGDLQFALHMGHGDFPRIVVAPGDLQELFEDTLDAFNWAERYQTPVLLLADRTLGGNARTVEAFDGSQHRIDRGSLGAIPEALRTGESMLRYQDAADGISVRSILGQKDGNHWVTGDEHSADGHITEDVAIREAMMAKRLRKLEAAAREIPEQRKWTLHGPAEADLTVVAWGSTKGSLLEAMAELATEGLAVNAVQLRVLSPFPHSLAPVLRKAKRLVALEENATGQLRDVVSGRTGIPIAGLVCKTNGRPSMVEEVAAALRQAAKGEAKVVMPLGV